METSIEAKQKALCLKYGAAIFPTPAYLKVGVGRNLFEGIMPLNGLRHKPVGDTSGWFLWAGDELSQEDDFFRPMHIYHLHELLPSTLRYLLLPPGWRFITAPPVYEDIWEDKELLNT